MQSIEIKGHVYARKNWAGQLEYTFFDFDPNGDWFPVCEHRIVTEMPAGFDPRLAQVAALQAQLEKLRAEFTKRVTEINERIQSITAIEYTPAQEVTGPCERCGGSGVVDDGEINGCGGVEFSSGPIKCVKDCPDCASDVKEAA